MNEKIDNGGPAFPLPSGWDGMTLLDWFAGQALGFVAHDYCECNPMCAAKTAERCYEFAREMIKQKRRLQ